MQRKIGAIIGAIVSVSAGALLTTHGHKHAVSVAPPFIPVALAADDKIRVQQCTDAASSQAGWQVYNVILPPHTGPLDLHMVTLIDNKGQEELVQRTNAWPQPETLKFRMDTDADTNVKEILQSQGLPVKPGRVAYRIDMGHDGSSGENYQTVTYRHRPSGPQAEQYGDMEGAIGQKIMLYDELRQDDGQKPIENWQKRGVLEKLQPGLAHRFTTYIQFTPRHWPIRGKGNVASIYTDINRY